MTYPVKFRKKVLSVREREGLTFKQVAERFCIGVASVVRWSKQLEPKTYTITKCRKIDLKALYEDVCAYPDSYQYERAKRFGVCQKAIWYSLKKIGVTYKKKPKNTQRQTRKISVTFKKKS